jgi:hypothetical protein
MMEKLEHLLRPITQDPQRAALEKIKLFFASLILWESEQKILVLSLLPVWYTDDNAIVREKIRMMLVKLELPLLKMIIDQGIAEGIWKTPYPDQAGDLVLLLYQGLKDTFARQLIENGTGGIGFDHIQTMIAAFSDAMEHILGIPSHSLQLIDAETVQGWLA